MVYFGYYGKPELVILSPKGHLIIIIIITTKITAIVKFLC